MSVKRFSATALFKLKGKTDIERLRRMRDDEIDFSDAPKARPEDLARGNWVCFVREPPRRGVPHGRVLQLLVVQGERAPSGQVIARFQANPIKVKQPSKRRRHR